MSAETLANHVFQRVNLHDVKAVKEALDSGFPADSYDTFGVPLIHYACANVDMLELLEAHGANVAAKDSIGHTLLWRCVLDTWFKGLSYPFYDPTESDGDEMKALWWVLGHDLTQCNVAINAPGGVCTSDGKPMTELEFANFVGMEHIADAIRVVAAMKSPQP
jgi:hypothetical protein